MLTSAERGTQSHTVEGTVPGVSPTQWRGHSGCLPQRSEAVPHFTFLTIEDGGKTVVVVVGYRGTEGSKRMRPDRCQRVPTFFSRGLKVFENFFRYTLRASET